jgi:hypothetical protein
LERTFLFFSAEAFFSFSSDSDSEAEDPEPLLLSDPDPLSEPDPDPEPLLLSDPDPLSEPDPLADSSSSRCFLPFEVELVLFVMMAEAMG